MNPFVGGHGPDDGNDLHNAILAKATGYAMVLISKGSKEFINQSNSIGNTPLIYASWKGLTHLVKSLLQRGADTDAKNAHGYNALHACALRGDHASALLLVRAGADLHHAEDWHGATALHMASQVGHILVMRVLVKAGADVDRRGQAGATPLYLATSRGQTDAVEFLLEAKANPRIPCARYTPLEAAAKLEHVGVVNKLLQHAGIKGCDEATGGRPALVYAAQQQNVEIMTLLCNAGTTDFAGDALRSAVLYGREISIKFLLQKCHIKWLPVYVNTRDADGLSPLGCCFNKSSLRLFSCRIVRLLCDAGANSSYYEKIRPATESDLRDMGYTAADEKAIGLQEICHLLQRLPAARAVSWGWPSSSTGKATRTKTKTQPFQWRKVPGGTRVLTRAIHR